MYKIAVYTHC